MRFKAGEQPGRGVYRCIGCGTIVALESDSDALPFCATCRNTEFEMVL